jgi:ssDNA-binding Zn-finger/Zn-ribbon topoisomerase 1
MISTCGKCKHYILNDPCAAVGANPVEGADTISSDCSAYQVGWQLCPECHGRTTRISKKDYHCPKCNKVWVK